MKTSDHRSVFSLALRVSWCGSSSNSGLSFTESSDHESLEWEKCERSEDQALHDSANFFHEDLPNALNAEDSEHVMFAAEATRFEAEGNVEKFEDGEEFCGVIQNGIGRNGMLVMLRTGNRPIR